MIILIGCSWSVAIRDNSIKARAGIIRLGAFPPLVPLPPRPTSAKASETSWLSEVTLTESRKPSAAAMVNLSSWNCNKTPVKTRRLSSVAAAKTTCLIIVRSDSGSSRMAISSSLAVATAGNSWASIPLIFDSKRAQRILSVWVASSSCISIRSGGKELTNSVNRRAGTVIAPVFSTLAPTQQLIPSSKLLADNFNCPLSVANKTFDSTGSVLRLATTRPTILKPLARFSCKQETFMVTSFNWQ